MELEYSKVVDKQNQMLSDIAKSFMTPHPSDTTGCSYSLNHFVQDLQK